MTTFQRARNDEQRELRRQAILGTAMEMLARMPVSQLTLNELARQTGLAKSNVLRYFETREAVLLDLLDSAVSAWLDSLENRVSSQVMTLADDTEHLPAVLAASLSDRPVLCDLLSAQSAVLEHNVSADVAARYKLSLMRQIGRLAGLVQTAVPRIHPHAAVEFAGLGMLTAGALWSSCQPSPAMLQAYAAHPELAAFRMDFEPALREALAILLAGVLARGPGKLPFPAP